MSTTVTLTKTTSGRLGPIALTSFLLFSLILLALAIGAVPISPSDAFNILAHQLTGSGTIDATQEIVLLNIRLPRLLLTILVGAALGISGAVLQGLFRNPLVEPSIIGVSSGSALGTMAVIMLFGFFWADASTTLIFWLRPMFAFGGGLLATIATLSISQKEGKTQITYLLLSGIAISALAMALIGFAIFYANDNQLRTYTFWTLGDLSGATWNKIYIMLPLVSISLVILLSLGRSLNAIAIGETEAFHSGVSIERVKKTAIFLSALVVGTSVAFVGIISFIGLVVPHIVRMARSADHTVVLPTSALGGASLLLLSDIIARTVVSPSELPIGVVTATIGAPFFIYLIVNAKRKGLL